MATENVQGCRKFVQSLQAFERWVLSMDLLLEAISSNRLGNAGLVGFDIDGSWGADQSENPASYILLVQAGSCWVLPAKGKNPILLKEGDVAIVTGLEKHALGSEADVALGKCCREGAPGNKARLVFGYYASPRSSVVSLLSSLPPFIHIKAECIPHDHEVHLLKSLLLKESRLKLPGSEPLVTRLVDSILIYLLRLWQNSAEARRYFGAKAVPNAQIAEALKLIHQRYNEDWSLEALAVKSSMSRSVFSRRFARIVGQSPLSYLIDWRMNVATQLLVEENLTLSEIAQKIGYESEYSFSKAFKRLKGVAPGLYRCGERSIVGG